MKIRKMVVLEERIAEAFVVGAKSDNVCSLIGEVEAAASAAGAVADLARERALEPTLSTGDVATARREMEDAAFRRDRMQVAVIKLGERLRELRAQEEEQRRWLAYEMARAERDKLAAELKNLYPAVAANLADLMARIEANDREVERINTQARPNGSEWLLSAEMAARGLNGFNDGATNISRITRDLRLPSFEYNHQALNVWPRSQ
jgi:hypothetical protein